MKLDQMLAEEVVSKFKADLLKDLAKMLDDRIGGAPLAPYLNNMKIHTKIKIHTELYEGTRPAIPARPAKPAKLAGKRTEWTLDIKAKRPPLFVLEMAKLAGVAQPKDRLRKMYGEGAHFVLGQPFPPRVDLPTNKALQELEAVVEGPKAVHPTRHRKSSKA